MTMTDDDRSVYRSINRSIADAWHVGDMVLPDFGWCRRSVAGDRSIDRTRTPAWHVAIMVVLGIRVCGLVLLWCPGTDSWWLRERLREELAPVSTGVCGQAQWFMQNKIWHAHLPSSAFFFAPDFHYHDNRLQTDRCQKRN